MHHIQRTDTNEEKRPAYRRHLFSQVPLYTTRLIREGLFTFTEREQVTTPEGVAVVLQDYFEGKDREEFVIVLLDTANTMIGLSTVSVGGLAASIVEPRQVMKVAILANAASIICAHNHLSGNPEPSQADIHVTRQLREAGKLMGVPVHDHLIITGDGYTSLAEHGIFDQAPRG